jgi:hypothetical protein
MVRPLPVLKKVGQSRKAIKICDGPTTGYKDGPDGVVNVKSFKNGWLPGDWFDNPVHCANCTGHHATTIYVSVG